MGSVPTQVEDAVRLMVRAARALDAAKLVLGVILLDAVRSVTTVAKETLVAPLVKNAAAAEDAVILGITVLRWAVNVDAARTEAPAPALVVATITLNAPQVVTYLALERTSAARPDTNATVTLPTLPNAQLPMFHQLSQTPTQIPMPTQILQW